MDGHTGLNDQDMLDLSNQAKEMVEKAEKKSNELSKENLELKKAIISVYGMVRILDMIYAQSNEPEVEVDMLIDTIRSYLSDYCEENIIKYSPPEVDSD